MGSGEEKEAFVLGNSGGGSSVLSPGAGWGHSWGTHGDKAPAQGGIRSDGPAASCIECSAAALVQGQRPGTCVTGDTRAEQGENGHFGLFQKYHKLAPVERIWEYEWERASPSCGEQVTSLSMR